MYRFPPYLLWILLSLPALGMANDLLTSDSSRIFHRLLHPSGEFAARFMIIAMLASPLMLIFKGWRGPQWLKKNRRYFGVAAFAYAAVHTVLYVLGEGSFARIMGEVTDLEIWTGWVAFIIFIPLAVTSMDYFVRAMGPRWKTLQRWTYAAAVLTLVHWAALHNWHGVGPALVHFVPLGLLEGYRVWYWYLRPRKKVSV